ncbi:serine/arginine repetitive matrix protein 2-like isoform X1 [Colletes gigas]|uniref:serine/arginine repetitive matrix protein 2-like isoform X1 n=2 Tax=Colletes gigas TaxID=935657 RepID=UPI001C9AC217|nr:serine/arginine repetitive matrix protein 2-like isoform X1 [Colletes gigas]XP_043263097.1 serine/arginine repetitive matrix protein 2-like isoform X1 [Colletes gigas]XP_043263098.1 serine/arginine repetitive matrix protein 2-like isoform X1 [Colletes gigas]XP_043263099.1 serine/arginine repetitive matrix protein 2-like isoform X1 [Colletes gigas]
MSDMSKKMKDSSVKNNVQNESTDQVCQKQSVDKKESTLKSTNEDVQRAIEGLKDIPDEELQEFLDDEDFMEGLDVVDAWEGDEEKSREVDLKTSHGKEQEQKRPSRDRHRRDRKGSYNRERPKKEEKKHEEVRRDPSKSTKDIERDKIRTKRDNESKLLAEKEKAIKHLLDSDNVVPPGTEAEAIQSIAEKQNLEQAQMHIRRSRERRRSLERQGGNSLRRRTPDRVRLNSLNSRRKSPLILSPERCRSPFKMSIERHRSPLRFSPEKRRSPRFNCVRRSPFAFSPERRRSPIRSWERRTSTDRRWSAERHRRRTNIHERRRSRSRDRQRSRSMERIRRKASRSPINRRYSPRRRSRTRSRSIERRTRKRSPFINELTRQLRNEAIVTSHINTGYAPPPPMEGIPPLMNTVVYQQEAESRPPIPMPPYIHQSGLPPPMPSNVTTPGGPPPFMNFENSSQSMNFDSVPLHPLPQTEYVSGPVMYNQSNTSSIQPAHRPPLLPAPISSPQPEPATGSMEHAQTTYSSSHGIPSTQQSPIQNFEFTNKSKDKTSQNYRERFRDSYNGYHASQEERLKTPEPPVISDTKQFEKTSLSSLLEASVSTKDSANLPVLYPGFKPEILRHCEHALRELPTEDPRLKMKGRFFYNPKKEKVQNEQDIYSSNSILLQRSKCKIYWEEEEGQHLSPIKHNVQTHQKICQTDEVETNTKFVQASVIMVDFEVQVYPQDLQHVTKEEKRPIMDRLDWNMRETFDYTPKFREADDLRWSLSNSSQKRTWNRTVSPPRRTDDREHRVDSVSSLDHNSRNLKLGSPIRNRDNFSSHKGSLRDHYVHERYSPNYRHSLNERDDFHESRSDVSRGESPMMLDDSAEEIELEQTFQRGTDWHGRGKLSRGRSSPLIKQHVYRGKHSGGRSYRGRGSFRGKF